MIYEKEFNSEKDRNNEVKIYKVMSKHGIAPKIVNEKFSKIIGNNTKYFFSMQKYQMTFEQFLKQSPQPTMNILQFVVNKIVKLIEKMHKLGYRHGDLHAQNIVVSKVRRNKTVSYKVKIIDFGANLNVMERNYVEWRNTLLKNTINELTKYNFNKMNFNSLTRSSVLNLYNEILQNKRPFIRMLMYNIPGKKMNYFEFLAPLYSLHRPLYQYTLNLIRKRITSQTPSRLNNVVTKLSSSSNRHQNIPDSPDTPYLSQVRKKMFNENLN